ncbi:hypothetical protein A4A49_36185 [Nicotiana attenuata]|uniref:Uncharacterized protein n=1 Tax=Nicotiana attenuata TaxID=49451 RepID=A0A1J6K8X2_NICAT|nr:hypothetical protein A4A49_36185 [Nicotiana attenuata]
MAMASQFKIPLRSLLSPSQIEEFSKAMPTLVQLMASSSASNVESTILLLMRCRQFQIDDSEDCLRKMYFHKTKQFMKLLIVGALVSRGDITTSTVCSRTIFGTSFYYE